MRTVKITLRIPKRFYNIVEAACRLSGETVQQRTIDCLITDMDTELQENRALARLQGFPDDRVEYVAELCKLAEREYA